MSTQEKRKDDELEVWVIVGALFTLGLLFFDFFYSSVNEMAQVARIAIWVGHALVSLGWIISLIQWKNPNYDDTRKGVVGLCVVLMLIIGIHHASVKEDQQVLIDSKENSAKP
jgi:glucose uptake protein GlcU